MPSRFLLTTLLLLLAVPLPALGETPVPQLSVRGEAVLEIPADQARLEFAVVATAPDAETALARNSRAMKAVEESLVGAGLGPEDYRTGRFTIRPEWSPRPRDAGEDWRPAIVGYTVDNSLEVVTGRLADLGRIIEGATRAGANRVEGLTFELADPGAHRARAITEAAGNARAEARALAGAAGVALGPVLTAQLDPADRQPEVRMLRMAAESAAPPLAPGTVTVRAAVSLTYRIDGD